MQVPSRGFLLYLRSSALQSDLSFLHIIPALTQQRMPSFSLSSLKISCKNSRAVLSQLSLVINLYPITGYPVLWGLRQILFQSDLSG